MKALLCLVLFYSTFVLSEELPLEARVFDAEAQINLMQNDVNELKNLANQEKSNAFNPNISLSVDMLGQYGFLKKEEHVEENADEHDDDHVHEHGFKNGFLIREVELEFKADIDPFAYGLVSLAVEQEKTSKFVLHLEEAYAKFNWFKLGRFKSSFGRNNQMHLHALPQINRPLALKNFLGDEGLFSQGFSISNNLPLANNHSLLFSLEGMILTKTPKQKKGAEKYPSNLARIWWHSNYDAHYIDLGLSNFLGAKGKKEGIFDLLGADFHYSLKPTYLGPEPLLLFGHESFLAFLGKNSKEWQYGNFSWSQLRILANTFLGVRYDLSPLEEKTSLSHALSLTLSYYTSEFLRFRLGIEHFMPKLDSFDGDYLCMFNVVFIMGSHPQDPYIVNR